MKYTQNMIACLLLALSLLALSSCQGEFLCEVCGKPAFNHVCCPAAPCPVCGSTTLCDCAAETVVKEESTSVRTEERASAWLERPLMYVDSGLVRTRALAPIAENGIDTSAGEKMYAQAGIGSIKFAELPTQFEIKWDERIEVQSISVTRYPLYDHKTGEECETAENKLVFEAGYYYEIRLITPTGTETYGITTAAAPVKLTSPTNPRDIHISYTLHGEEKQTKITESMYEARWDASDPSSYKVVQTASSTPYNLPGLCEISVTEPTVRLIANREIAAYVISAAPVDENNKIISGTGRGKTFTVADNTFSLLEGSFYYSVYVCFDGGSFTNYGFIAHYTPEKGE